MLSNLYMLYRPSSKIKLRLNYDNDTGYEPTLENIKFHG